MIVFSSSIFPDTWIKLIIDGCATGCCAKALGIKKNEEGLKDCADSSGYSLKKISKTFCGISPSRFPLDKILSESGY